MTRVYHRHHCHLYHNQHWISLFPIKNSLECGTKNDNAKFSNIVPQSSLHVNKIRWLNLTFIISQKHGEFPAEIKQFWLEKIINLKIYIKRLKCWRKAIDTQETWMGQTLDNTIWFLVYKIDFSFELVFFKRLNKNLVSTEANLWNLLKSIWHSFRSSLFPLSFQSQSQYFIYILYNYYFLWKMHYHLLKNLPCQLLLSYFYLIFSYSTTDKLEKAKCQSSKAQRQSSTDILKNKDLN